MERSVFTLDSESRQPGSGIRSIHDPVGGATSKRKFETLWDGWQAVAEYELIDDGQGGSTPRLVGRRVYGRGLDEIVAFEHAVGNSLATLVPFYDVVGNVALMADVDGRVVERYEYSPYGERRIFVDSTAPAVEQVRRDGDGLVLELSEAVRAETLIHAVASGDLDWTHLGQGQPIPYALSLESGTDRSAYRVWRLTP